MSAPLAPSSFDELVEVVRSSQRVLAVGAGTKPRLSEVDAAKVSMLRLHGVVEYEPSEFTFTALAGTPIEELKSILAGRGQYLPFDPVLTQAGATLGGTVSAGLSGPGRLRFGGLKDFILGVRFVDGLGRLLRIGGKVVKNAAGFDLPKFFVGSLGRFGVLTEFTFKVFPAPASSLTLKLAFTDIESAARVLIDAASARWEVDALDVLPGSCQVLSRLAGPAEAIQEMAKEILARWPGEELSIADAKGTWANLGEFQWTHLGGTLVKIALTPSALTPLYHEMRGFHDVRVHVSSGGHLAFISLENDPNQQERFNQALCRLGLSGIALRGKGPLWRGVQSHPGIAQKVKEALDPQNRFPGLDD